MKDIARHKFAYIFLAVGIVLLIGLYMAAWPNYFWQRVIAIGFSVFYIVWGMIAHVKSSHITKNIVYEYLGIGILGGAILLLLTI